MRKRATALLAAFMTGTLMFGCGGQGSQGSNGNTTPAENSTTTDEQKTDGTVEIGDYVAAAKDGKIELPGYTFTLPDDIAQGDYNVAGWARISFDGMWGRIWIYDPNEDLVSQVTKPGFFEIDGIPAGKTMKEALDELKELGEEVPEGAEDIYIDLGENGTYHYYALDVNKAYELFGAEDEDYAQLGIDQERIDTAKSLEGRLDEFVKCFEATDLKLPVIQTAEDVDVQALSNLTLEDLDGNKVRLGDVFAQNKLTMIDIWKTDCGACIESMPDLEELQKSLHDKGFGVLGVNCDVLDENGKADEFLLEDALDIVESTGTTYPTVLADSQFLGLIDVYATPTTLFVDSEGNVVDGPSAGAYPKDMLTGIIEGNLEKVS